MGQGYIVVQYLMYRMIRKNGSGVSILTPYAIMLFISSLRDPLGQLIRSHPWVSALVLCDHIMR
jgi:hypothetical protein